MVRDTDSSSRTTCAASIATPVSRRRRLSGMSPREVALAACGCAMGVSRSRFMLVTAAARIPRYAGLAYLGAQLGENSTAWIKGHTWHMTILAIVLFAGLYALLRWSERKPSPAA